MLKPDRQTMRSTASGKRRSVATRRSEKRPAAKNSNIFIFASF